MIVQAQLDELQLHLAWLNRVIGAMNLTAQPVVTNLPDLIVASLSYAAGRFYCTVRNTGSAMTPSGVPIGVAYLVDGVQRTYGSVSGSLAPGATVSIGTDVAGGLYVIPEGEHTVGAHVDDTNRIEESDKANNYFSIQVGTAVVAPPAVVPAPAPQPAPAAFANIVEWAKANGRDIGGSGYSLYIFSQGKGTDYPTIYATWSAQVGPGPAPQEPGHHPAPAPVPTPIPGAAIVDYAPGPPNGRTGGMDNQTLTAPVTAYRFRTSATVGKTGLTSTAEWIGTPDDRDMWFSEEPSGPPISPEAFKNSQAGLFFVSIGVAKPGHITLQPSHVYCLNIRPRTLGGGTISVSIGGT